MFPVESINIYDFAFISLQLVNLDRFLGTKAYLLFQYFANICQNKLRQCIAVFSSMLHISCITNQHMTLLLFKYILSNDDQKLQTNKKKA